MVQSRFQKLFWNQHFYMVSNLLVEIAIYNFDLFHSALLSISTTKLLNKPLLTGNCACSKSRTSVSCKSLVRGETLPWFLWQQDGCLSSVWRFSTKLSLNLNFPAPPGNLVFAIWSCWGQGFSEEPCDCVHFEYDCYNHNWEKATSFLVGSSSLCKTSVISKSPVPTELSTPCSQLATLHSTNFETSCDRSLHNGEVASASSEPLK